MEQHKNGTINLILALHNHQPEGNLPEVFERTFALAYEPFIAELERHPRIKVVQHYSGILFRWLQQHKPEFLARLRNLVFAGRMEIMGGAFFEPILVMIPDDDKIGQLEKQSRFIRENFQVEVSGAWLAERIWEPHLARPLAKAGICYTVLDDAHFYNVGFAEDDLLHYFVTEEGGEKLFIFPISEKLRYLIPFAKPEETIDYLRSKATASGERVAVLADDGEKFGSWPGTSKHVYGEKWLERFFSLLEENSDWLNVITFSEYIKLYPPAGPVYLPAGSYREMMQWSGGFWRNFFVRYPESNQIHKKMLHVRRKLDLMPEGPRKQEAREYLWAGQCNCAYWHGVFGGLYLNFLRSALYSRLIAAEDIIDHTMQTGGSWLELATKDFDYDGKEEIIVNGPDLGLILSPASGGALLELDFKPRRFNLLDVLSRRPEPYHCNIFEMAEDRCPTGEVQTIHQINRVKEAGLEKLLIYDSYRRASLIDHFFVREATLDDFARNPVAVEAGDFVSSPYAIVESRVLNGSARVVMAREGLVRAGDATIKVSLVKTVEYLAQSGELQFIYKLLNTGIWPLEAYFAVEFNINFLAGRAADRYYVAPGRKLADRFLDSRGQLSQVREFGLVDEWQGIATNFIYHRPADVWRLPLETVSQSEEGMERVYQGSTVIPLWRICLIPGEPWFARITQRVRESAEEVVR